MIGPCKPASCVSSAVGLVDWLTQKNNSNSEQHRTTQRTGEFTWFGLRPTSMGDQWRVSLFKRIEGKGMRITHSNSSSLKLQGKKEDENVMPKLRTKIEVSNQRK